jgi:sugar phosphate isomerase/epimerase
MFGIRDKKGGGMKHHGFLWRGIFIGMVLSLAFCGGRVEQIESGQPFEADEAEPEWAFPVLIRPPYDEIRVYDFPLAMQCWTFRKFTFMETLDKIKEMGVSHVEAYPGQILSRDHSDIKFDHNLEESWKQAVKEKMQATGIRLINYGVVGFENNEASMKKVFDFAKEMGIRTIITEPAFDDYSLLEKMVKETGIQIGIHNHPDPSKYARPETVLKHIEGLDSRIGVCADIGHWMRTGVNPLQALQMLQGRIIDVHLKDLDRFGTKEAVDVPYGQGEANIHNILAELTYQDYDGVLTIEYEDPDAADNPVPPVLEGIQYIDNISYYSGFRRLLEKSRGRYHKHGWNHYGPGYFILDPERGILKSQGGMGLFWFSRKEFRDFILTVDFMSAKEDTNSGIFLRVPEVPVSDDYIYHSFEIQIYHAGEEKHKTGAVYDVKAPDSNAYKPAEQWNHLKMTFDGDHLEIEINGTMVLDWNAVPGGKVKDFARKGYIGLQNHDSRSPVYFRNVFIKELRQSAKSKGWNSQ